MGHSRVGCYPCIISGFREWKACWRTEEGKQNILKLIEIEQTLRSQGLTAVRIRDNFDGKKLLKLLENEEKQAVLFKELICSFCHF